MQLPENSTMQLPENLQLELHTLPKAGRDLQKIALLMSSSSNQNTPLNEWDLKFTVNTLLQFKVILQKCQFTKFSTIRLQSIADTWRRQNLANGSGLLRLNGFAPVNVKLAITKHESVTNANTNHDNYRYVTITEVNLTKPSWSLSLNFFMALVLIVTSLAFLHVTWQ